MITSYPFKLFGCDNAWLLFWKTLSKYLKCLSPPKQFPDPYCNSNLHFFEQLVICPTLFILWYRNQKPPNSLEINIFLKQEINEKHVLNSLYFGRHFLFKSNPVYIWFIFECACLRAFPASRLLDFGWNWGLWRIVSLSMVTRRLDISSLRAVTGQLWKICLKISRRWNQHLAR